MEGERETYERGEESEKKKLDRQTEGWRDKEKQKKRGKKRGRRGRERVRDKLQLHALEKQRARVPHNSNANSHTCLGEPIR